MAVASQALSSPAKWNYLNSFYMTKSKSLTSQMLKQVRSNEEVERASKDAATEQTVREKQQLRESVFAKAAVHGGVIATSSNCMRDIEDGVLQTDNSVALLRQNRALAFAALQVCKRRSQLRDRRPKSELIKDYVAIALESEQKLLEAAREEYLQMEAHGKKISEDLSTMRNHLSADTGSRRLIMKKDHQTLNPHLAPPPEMQRAPPVIEDADSHSLLEDTFNLLNRSNKHREKTIAAIARIKSDSHTAVTRTEDTLEKRTDELTAIGRDLKAHMTDAEAAIAVSERSLDKSTKRLDPADSSKREKLIRDRALLDQLKSHKDILHHDIQHKFIALEIDNMCRRVTPVKACEPSLLDAQNGPPPGVKSLANSASAPNLLASAGASATNFNSNKLPNLGGTMDSFSRDKFGSTATKFNSGGNSLNSSTSSAALKSMKATH